MHCRAGVTGCCNRGFLALLPHNASVFVPYDDIAQWAHSPIQTRSLSYRTPQTGCELSQLLATAAAPYKLAHPPDLHRYPSKAAPDSLQLVRNTWRGQNELDGACTCMATMCSRCINMLIGLSCLIAFPTAQPWYQVPVAITKL